MSHRYLTWTCLFVLALLLVVPRGAGAFTAASLGDYGNVTVMEISGDYSALDPYGRPNTEPRRAIAREFYRSHGDDYDFLVIFTNFNFGMPAPDARAFFSPAKNDVQGIGLDLFDHTNTYSADGSYLERLAGTIDMASLSSHVLEPTDPKFDKTLLTLTHEMLHRWGAYISFMDGGVPSTGLLGLDDAHWSFLLDSGGSSLYGNTWLDNGDGTFTSIQPEQGQENEPLGRIFNPLERYLMGLLPPDQVPPLTLIVNPVINKSQSPEIGVTITGTVKTVTVEDIIAAEGARIPTAADARREFRAAFIYAVNPGTWSATDDVNLGELAAIGRLQTEWEKRFSILTDGAALMRTSFAVTQSVDGNPGLTAPTTTPHVAPLVDAGVNWLLASQRMDGSWSDLPGTAQRDTAAAVAALLRFPAATAGAAKGQAWLGTVTPDNSDFLARKLLSLDAADPAHIEVLQNPDGGWGSAPGYRSNPLDTALALIALDLTGSTNAVAIDAAVACLHAAQNADGGWSAGSGGSLVQPTAYALRALAARRTAYPLEPAIADGIAWLGGKQNLDGGFGNSPSTVYDTATALTALKTSGVSASIVDRGVQYLLAGQDASGSWNGSAFQTALAVEALYAGQVAPDLTLTAADITFTPATIDVVPADVTVTATVHNTGRTAVSQAGVALFRGDPALGDLVGETIVDIPGGGSAPAVFTTRILDFGLHPFRVLIDGQDQIEEADEWNNSASRSLAVNMPPPTIGFDAPASSEAESRTTVGITVRLSYPWSEPVRVDYRVIPATTALSPGDYTLSAGVLTFSPNEVIKTIPLTVVNDQVAEIDKVIVIELLNPSLGTLAQTQHIYTILDDEPPSISISSPAPGVSGSNTPQLAYTTTGSSVLVKVDGQVVSKTSGDRLGPLPDGDHTLDIEAANGLGLSNTARVDFTVDTTVPTVTILSPVGLQTVNTPLLDYLADGADSVEVRIDGVMVTKTAGQYLDPLSEGSHAIMVTATNVAGRSSSRTESFIVDTTPPRVKLRFPNNGGILSEAAPLLLYDLSESGSVSVTVDGIPVAKTSGNALDPLTEGGHVVRVTLTDANGISATDQAKFVISTGQESPYSTSFSTSLNGYQAALDNFDNIYVLSNDSLGDYNPRISKYDSAGNLLWTKARWSAIYTRDNLGVGVDSEGSVYFSFTTYDAVDGYTAKGYDDCYLAKFDAVGNWVWTRQLATPYSDYAYDVHVDGEDNVYISGVTGGYLFGGGSGWKVYAAKYSKDGTRQWGYQYALGMNSIASEPERSFITTDRSGNVYVACDTTGSAAGTSYGLADLFVAKFSSNGTYLGAGQYGTGQNDRVYGLGVDELGNIYVSGNTAGSFSGYALGGFFDNYLLKFNSAFQVQWVHQWGEADYDYIYDLGIEPDGDAFVIGGQKIYRFDRNMNLIWSQPYLTSGTFGHNGIARVGGGHLFLMGNTSFDSGRLYHLRDPRLPDVTANNIDLTNQLTVPATGTVSAGATVSVSNATGIDCSNFRYQDGTTWTCDLHGMAEGYNWFAVEATSQNGFMTKTYAEITLDTIRPELVIYSPSEGATYSDKPVISFKVEDQHPGKTTALLNGRSVFPLNLPLEGLLYGQNLLEVVAVDGAGNRTSQSVTFFAVGEAVGERPYTAAALDQFGSTGADIVDQIIQDAAGHVYLVGTAFGNLDGQINSGLGDVFVRKYDASGAHLWTRLIGTQNSESGKGIAADKSGNIYIFYQVDYAVVKKTNWSDVVVAKYDSSFNLLWSEMIGSTQRDTAVSLAIDGNENVYIGGNTEGSINRWNFQGPTDYFAAKYDNSGNQIWFRQSVAPGGEHIYDLALNENSSFISFVGIYSDGNPFIISWPMSGDWSRGMLDQFLPDRNATPTAIAIDANGNTYAAGHVKSAYGLDDDAFVYIFGKVYEFGTYGRDSGSGILADNRGNVYVLGTADKSLNSDVALGNQEILVGKFSTSGAMKWQTTFGTAGSDEAVGAVLSSKGDLLVAGATTGDLFNSNHGQTDIFLVRMNPVQGPSLLVEAPVSPTRMLTQDLRGTATPGATVAVSFDLPIDSSATISPIVYHPDGTWETTVTGLIANSENVLTVTATDPTGSASATLSIWVDTLPPVLEVGTVVSPTISASLLISGTIEDGASLFVESNPPALPLEVPVDNGRWEYSANLLVGSNAFTFIATDAAGNTTTETVAITYQPPPPLSLTLSPVLIAENEAADLNLTVANVHPAGSRVLVEQRLDLDGNGLADSGEPVVRRFTVTDGVALGNPNVPCDSDGKADGTITTLLGGQFANDRYHAVGAYVFTAATATDSASQDFTVYETVQAQSLSGVVSDSSDAPIGGALVELLDPWGRSGGFAMTDTEGRYRFNLSLPGELRPIASADGFVFDTTSPGTLTVAAGQALTRDVTLTAGSHQVSGRVLDVATSAGVAGVTVRAEGDQYLATALTDFEGNYRLQVPAGDYAFIVEAGSADGLSAQGYVGSLAPLAHLAVSGEVTGNDLPVVSSALLECGTVTAITGSGIAGVPVQATNLDGSQSLTVAASNLQGEFCLGLDAAGNWQIVLDATEALGWVGTAAVSGSPAVTVHPVDFWVAGTTWDDSGQPVPGVRVKVSHPTGAETAIRTASDGRYRLGISTEPAGDWILEINSAEAGFEPVPPISFGAQQDQSRIFDFTLTAMREPLQVTLNPVQTPTDRPDQMIGGTRSPEAVVTVSVDTAADVGEVLYPSATTWECLLANLAEGINRITVNASAGSDSAAAPEAVIDYRPPQLENTIAITKAVYDRKKQVLSVEATSAYPDAQLQVEGYGPMVFAKLFKGRYVWTFSRTVAVKPATITVFGPEGAVTVPVE